MFARIGSFLVFGLSSSAACAQPAESWPQLSLATCQVDQFIKANPTSDGRGVVVAVFDTGVDPSIPGLTLTPDGEVKVIDVQDFSGQGDTDLHRVRLDEESGQLVEYDDDGSPVHYDLPALPASATGEERRFWFAYIDEGKFVNSDVPDLNDNGTTDDKFPLVVTALSGDGDDQAVCYVDTNLDRSFANEKPLRNYKLNYDTFVFHREKPEKQIVPAAFAINIFLRQAKIVLYYDDGAHGTHVAGIAAGYRINDQDGFNGIAPGAKVIGIKIGQNAIGGVSTTEAFKKSFEYVARFARENDVQVVCNLSYGVESVIEPNSDIDKFVDGFLRKHPHLMFCTSAGNEGPGLSSVGTPAAATEAVSVAAILAADSARNVMGYDLDEPILTAFSSRGGELDKPDIATPGWSTSTVPRWIKKGDYWPGTSMASPYAAGLCAVLISDAQARHPGRKIRAWDVRRALAVTAKPVPGHLPLSYGYGLPDLPAAAKMLDKLVASAKDDPIIGHDISTSCPHGYEGRARAAYWRSTFFPTDEDQTFTIKPVFAPSTDMAERTSFTRKYQLRSTVPWCTTVQKEVYLRSEQAARVYVKYEAEKLTEPGVHVGAIEAYSEGILEFRLLNTIVVPYRGKVADDFALSFKDQIVDGWRPTRYFLTTPPGASVMELKLSAPEGRESKARIDRIFDPTGSRLRRGANRLDTTAGRREVSWSVADSLVPGVWEIPIIANRPDKQWPFDLDVRFFGLHAEPKQITEWAGSPPAGGLTVTNVFEHPVPTAATGELEGYRKYKEDNFEGLKDELSYTLTLDDNYDRLRVDLEMTPEAYATTTDIGVAVEANGEEIHFSAFSNRTHKRTVDVPVEGEETTVTVFIRGGFAVADDKRETPITVKIDQLLADPIPIEVTYGKGSRVRFIPGVPTELEFALDSKPPANPGGLRPVGYLEFRERSSEDLALRVPIDING
ncbi:MAG: S8 family serine peptidase [Phycisphaerales bacterium]|nr:MAG: S8 family serine peptidase [Phycisphaerales bacterium]